MKKLPTVLSILFAALVIGGAIVFSQKPGGSGQIVQNVSMEGEKQVIEIDAKGGYSPKLTTAKAGVPTVLRLKTNGTYDCSSAITIPTLGFRKNLDATGVTEVAISAESAKGSVEGVCAMGMYNFSVKFL